VKMCLEAEVVAGARVGAGAEGGAWMWMKAATARMGGHLALLMELAADLVVVLPQMLAQDIFPGPVRIHRKARVTGLALEVFPQIA